MDRTQDFVPLQDVNQGMVILKDGSAAMIIETSAVNFDLLSENEQMAIIGSFAGLLNSLSFPIQIVIRSKKLDISSYLEKLVIAEQHQDNPLLKKLMQNYRYFVSSVIRENEVLDKQFFVVISVSSLELGIIRNKDAAAFMQKAITALTPRRDHIIRQLGRIGLKASQLGDEKLIRLFYDWYNEPVFDVMDKQKMEDEKASAADVQATLHPPVQPALQPVAPIPQASQPAPSPTASLPVSPPTPQPLPVQQPIPVATQPIAPPPIPVPVAPTPAVLPVQPLPTQPIQNPYPNIYPAQKLNPQSMGQVSKPATTPFVVEELHDEYGNA